MLLIDDLNGFSQLAPALSSSFSWNPGTAWGSDQLVNPGLPGLVGSQTVNGMRALAAGAPRGEDGSSAFVQDFKSAQPHNVKLAPFAAQEFDATVLCYLSAVAAGSTDGQQMADELIDITAPGGDEFSWQQLPDAIKALEDGKDINYTGASGPIDMDVHGNPTAGVFDVYQYTPDLEAVGEVSVSKPNPVRRSWRPDLTAKPITQPIAPPMAARAARRRRSRGRGCAPRRPGSPGRTARTRRRRPRLSRRCMRRARAGRSGSAAAGPTSDAPARRSRRPGRRDRAGRRSARRRHELGDAERAGR